MEAKSFEFLFNQGIFLNLNLCSFYNEEESEKFPPLKFSIEVVKFAFILKSTYNYC